MAEKMKIKIVAPEKIFYEGDTTFLELTTTEGDIGVYPKHIPITAVIAPGILKIHQENEVKEAALLSGFIEILQEEVNILAESVEWPDEIDMNRAEEAKIRAERRMQSADPIDLHRAELALKRSLIRLSVGKSG